MDTGAADPPGQPGAGNSVPLRDADEFAGLMHLSPVDFFPSLSIATGGGSEEKFKKLAVVLQTEHCCGSLAHMMKLTGTQFEDIVLALNGPVGWRGAVERALEVNFRGMAKASSSGTSGQHPQQVQQKPLSNASNYYSADGLTLGVYLANTGELENVFLDESVFECIKTPKPLETPITKIERDLMMTAIFLWTLCTFGRINVDQ